ncbi:uncharacterized protein LOC131593378 [Vicia villosa]|uniref:uncharacterized protein LOC131593378 n=1 Tax=Vicia villosa TaxID=3911 RepID=UPI00273BCD7A|nr:uncharacterized protein LOC131593378 [Vicia villosa]
MNNALLLKWKRRILHDDEAIWNSFIKARYFCPKIRIQVDGGMWQRKGESIWWKDLCKINLLEDRVANDFSGSFMCCCKNGKDVLFWHNRWLGDQPLRLVFPDLYALSSKKHCTVADILEWMDGIHRWRWEALFSADSIFDSSITAAAAASQNWARFVDMLCGFLPCDLSRDTFSWSFNGDNVFSVSSLAHAVDNAKPLAWDPKVIDSLKVLWDLKLPPKIKIFAWKVFIDRIPTRDQLLNRGVVNVTCPDCVMCGSCLESSSHLFFNCQEVKGIWKHVFLWLGTPNEFTEEEMLSFDVIQEKVNCSKRRILINYVWFATIWSIWLMRNAIIFKGEVFCFDVICSNIVFLSWRWLCSGYTKFRPIYYEWFKLPLSVPFSL